MWGGIQPPWIYSLMALHAEGYPHTHPVMAKGLGALNDPRWRLDTDKGTYVQACTSPVWDTLLTLLAVQDVEAETGNKEAVTRAVDWVLSKEVRTKGDWSVKVRGTEPGGFSFEYENLSYPDVDDTAVGLMVLSRLRNRPEWRDKGVEQVLDRAQNWVFGMQCDNGGWERLRQGQLEADTHQDPVQRLRRGGRPAQRRRDGPCAGRAGPARPRDGASQREARDRVHQGAPAARRKLVRPLGASTMSTAPGRCCRRSRRSARTCRRPMSARPRTGSRPCRTTTAAGARPACPTWTPLRRGDIPEATVRRRAPRPQTAWGLMGLVAVGRREDVDAVKRGIDYLLATQKDGTWDEPEFTGTGFPGYGFGDEMDFDDPAAVASLKQGRELGRGFMINYHMYRHYFPMMAMGRARKYLARYA